MPTMSQINERAQLYSQQVAAGQVQPPQGAYVSPYGITSMCMYTHNDSTPIETCAGVREWVNSTNAQRTSQAAGPTDMVRIVSDVLWDLSSTSVDQELYSTTFDQCPDDVDVLVVCGEPTTADAAAVAAALQSSQLRPKAAYSSSTLPSFDPTNSTILIQWNGWLTHASPAVTAATLPVPTFRTKAYFIATWQAYYTSPITPSSYQVLWPSIFEMFRAALSLTASLSSSDLRTAFLSLNGTTYVRGVLFDPLTGCNDGSYAVAAQIQGSAGLQLVSNAYPLVYPVPWPWRRVQVGDPLESSQSIPAVVLSVVMAVLGCWVAQIIVEQAVFVRRRRGLYQVWLMLVAIAVGVAGVWCAQFNMAGAVNVSFPSTGDQLSLRWSLWIALVAWSPAVLLTWTGLMVLMQDVEVVASAKKSSTVQQARQARGAAEEENRKRAAFNARLHLLHLRDRFSWKVAVGGMLIGVGMWLSRYALWSAWAVQATFVSSPDAWVVSAMLVVFVIVPSMLVYFHALVYRVGAVFALAAVIIVDWQMHIAMGNFEYAASVLATPTALYTVLLSSTTVTLITGVICAVSCFGFVGLQFSRMQLSRNGLSVLVASLEAVVNKLTVNQQHMAKELAKRAAQADSLAKLLECINIIRPISKEYAFALATMANMSTLAVLYDPTLSTAGPFSPEIQSLKTCTTVARSSTTTINRLVKRLRSSPSSIAPVEGAGWTTATSILAITNTIKLRAGDNAHTDTTVAREGETGPPITNDSVHRVAQRSSLGSRSASESMGAEDQEDINADHRGSLANPDAASSGVMHAPASRSARARGPPTSLPSARRPLKDGGRGTQVEQSTTSLTHASSVGGEMQDHAARCKQYSADVLVLLAEQLRHQTWSDMQTSSCGSVSDVAEFSLFMPSLGTCTLGERKNSLTTSGRGSNLKDSFSQWPAPSLLHLLQNPVCVEVLKDELEKIHSVEHLMFFLHVIRYRKLLLTSKARRTVAMHLFDTFISEGSEHQINISTRQRDSIAAAVRKGKEDACTPTLFQEAEREVSLLMETNLMQVFTGTEKHRLCVWLYHAIDMRVVVGAEFTNGEVGGYASAAKESSSTQRM